VTKTTALLDQLADLTSKKKQVTISGLTGNAETKIFLNLLATPRWDSGQAVFWFVDKKKYQEKLAQLHFWNQGQDIQVLTDITGGPELMTAVMEKTPGLFLLPAGTLEKYFPSPEEYQNLCLKIRTGKPCGLTGLLQHLQNTGYELADTAAEPGYFARRGGLVEIFAPGMNNPVRIEFVGDNVEQIQEFAPRSKETRGKLEKIVIPPFQLKSGQSSIIQALNSNPRALIIRNDGAKIKKAEVRQLVIRNLARGDIRFDFLPTSLYFGNLRLLAADLQKLTTNGYSVEIYTNKKEQLQKMLADIRNITYQNSAANLPIGYIDTLEKKVLLGSQEIFGPPEPEAERPAADEVFLSELEPGDFVVHIDHGVGKFIGMRRHLVDEGMREYYVLEYAEGDRLSVPVEYADKIDRYIGKANPSIHRLHGASWQQTKLKIKAATREIAGELLKLYAARESAAGHRYLPDTPEQIELERSFKYEDTPGQRRVTEEIKRDMEQDKPMDRLLVGDVGYGKTEVSVRAAFKAVQTGKQVALLCPTTILAEQHGKTYTKRLQNFPVRVEVLSRFKTKAQQQRIIDGLKSGEVDIVIGTHRLLSKDIAFKDLGLIIIDEEQRFGVEHKEKLKRLRNDVDVLAMSATPIPRTLHFSLAGLREISTIDTPPPGRQPIDTYIAPYDEKKIAKAVRAELERKGQIYFLHNRVETIEAFANRIKELVPEARIGVAHGQLPEKQLESIMHDFYHHRYEILVCSTIIESGLDIKNVNTLIVDEATRFGLSQLYQLRGRIGRGAVKANSYFFYQSKKLKGRAKDRLEALLAAKELGSGFKVARRDLEIRGTGNLLGREQHGSINAIGLTLYSRLLHQAVEEQKAGHELPPHLEVTIDLPIDAYIPPDFFATAERKLRAYKELANAQDTDQLNGAIGRIVANSRSCYSKKDLPLEIKNLILIVELKLIAQKLRLISIDTILKKTAADTRERLVTLTFAEDLDDEGFYKYAKENPAWQRKDERTIRISVKRLGDDWVNELKLFLEKLTEGKERKQQDT